MNHHTKTKEEKTAEAIKRVLGILTKADEPIMIGDKEHKKITFSQKQVTAALNRFATPQEHIDGIIFKNSSTISHNDTYKLLILEAKRERSERLDNVDGIYKDSQYGDNEKLSVTRLRVDIGILMADKKRLMDENKALKNIMKQAELKDFMDGDKPIEKVNEIASLDQKLVRILETLLIHGSKTMDIMIETHKGGKSAKLILQDFEDGGTHLGYVDNLASLNIGFKEDGERIVIVGKESIHG